MLASRNNPGEAHENGSVEAHDNHLKVGLDQALILRGSRDFAELAGWRRFVDELVARRNRRREAAVRIEMAALRPLPARRTTDFTEVVARVTKTGGFLVHQVFYSAPSQLIGKRLRVHVYDHRIEAFLGATHPRRRGRDDGLRVHCVNHRHVIHALRRKPQALAGSVYRDGLFPRSEYAEAWTALQAHRAAPAQLPASLAGAGCARRRRGLAGIPLPRHPWPNSSWLSAMPGASNVTSSSPSCPAARRLPPSTSRSCPG